MEVLQLHWCDGLIVELEVDDVRERRVAVDICSGKLHTSLLLECLMLVYADHPGYM